MNLHAEFARALRDDPEAADVGALRGLADQRGFRVYRNTWLRACIEALRANFPAVAQSVGEEWFRSAAARFATLHPPRDGRLLVYGDRAFAGFLAALPSTQHMPWLPGIAKLDLLWRQAHAAADAPALAPEGLAAVPPDALASRVLRPHPAARWAWFDAHPVASLWRSLREAQDHAPASPAWQGEGLLFTRPGDAVQWLPLGRSGCAFLAACRRGLPLGLAAERALRHADADLPVLLASLLQAGAFRADELGDAFFGEAP